MNDISPNSFVARELAEKISRFFTIYDIQQRDGNIFFFVTPKETMAEDGAAAGHNIEPKMLYQKLWAIFAEKGYQFSLRHDLGENVLIATPFKPVRERRWINVALLFATILSTMVMGAYLFGADPINNPSDVLKGIPFTIAIMTVLGAHESAHYIVAKRHGMNTSLPYFIPFPSMIGTMGAVIKHRGPIPDRKALFDVGISGPLVGLFVSIIVTIIGLLLPPIPMVSGMNGIQIILSPPPLFELLTRLISPPENSMLHPVAFAGWVGMLVTALNLIPAGQLDGGHVLRAMLGKKASYVSGALPFVLLLLGVYLTYVRNIDGSLWIFWGMLLFFFAGMGHPRPLDDDVPIGKARMALGIVTFILGLLCVTLVPFQVQ
ncbi:MAG: site-2 protease family protein [Candidatus Methanoperedens sp.]|nr:site-2 protease family protein [Candidatus Methanoperedens sp.]